MEYGTAVIESLKDLPLEDAAPAWYPRPIQRRVLYHDPETGVRHILVRYPADLNAPVHRHNCAHTILVLENEMIINGRTVGPGTYCHFPAGQRMLHTSTREHDCLFLIMFDQAAQFMVEGGETYTIG